MKTEQLPIVAKVDVSMGWGEALEALCIATGFRDAIFRQILTPKANRNRVRQ